MEGDMAQNSKFRFSSEYMDDELGLIYYTYRHFNPHDGRWINRDPISELEGWNLYSFVKNNLNFSFDQLGLAASKFSYEVFIKSEAYGTYLTVSRVDDAVKTAKKYTKGSISKILSLYDFLKHTAKLMSTMGLPAGDQIRIFVSLSCKCDDGFLGFFCSEKEMRTRSFIILPKHVPEYDGKHSFGFLGPAKNPEKFIKGLEKYIDQEVVKIVNPRKKECDDFCKTK